MMTSADGSRADGTILTGVSETALWTLRARADEARRPDSVIDDPMAITMMDSIDYDFAKFGSARRQDVPLRALAFDDKVRRYLAAHPQATVVALAEGLQTSFWRLDTVDVGGEFRWLTVDLPPIIELRRQLLPKNARISERAQSALDFSWMDDVDPVKGVFITVEGLLPYLAPEEAMGIIRESARRFRNGQMMFELPARWTTRFTRDGCRLSRDYMAPSQPFSLSFAEIAGLADSVPGVRAVHDIPIPRGRGPVFNVLLPTIQRIPLFNPLRPTLTMLEFG